MNLKTIIITVNQILETYPKSKNGQPYLVLENGKKLFFNRFIKKYGIADATCNYKKDDLARRLCNVEFFKYFLSGEFKLKPARDNGRLLLDSHFHRMVIIETKVSKSKKLELLSFYPL